MPVAVCVWKTKQHEISIELYWFAFGNKLLSRDLTIGHLLTKYIEVSITVQS